jgi:D-alanyl-D-alanine carboxypeptidase/D-alanyl-D-alanine-endopeptidase (penicillin-binding protein 4)
VFAVHLHKLLRDTFPKSVSGAVVFLFLLFLLPFICHSQELSKANKYITNGGYALAKNGKTVFSKNLKKLYIPASTVKLITSLAALEILGPDYHFSTRIYFDKTSKNLYIQGSGDPYLISENVHKITKSIASLGILEIADIVLDDSAFALEHRQTIGSDNSKNPYDANCSALAVNFNSLPLKVLQRAKVNSPEKQTPYLKIMGQIGKELTSGYHRVNIDAFPQINNFSNGLLYCGQLFQALLIENGITITGTIKHDNTPPDTLLLYHYQADENIRDLIQSCLLSSSNFMANQLYLALGVKKYGIPATWAKSRKAINDFIHNSLEITDSQIIMVEGSGLSMNNRISPEAMILVLEKFKPFTSLIPIKYGVRMKSGTLRKSCVFCYAGYIAKEKFRNPFVILLNQKMNGRDKILKILYRQ